MSSFSSQQGAREAPPPDQLAALYSLTDKVVSTGALCRHARNVELSARAALKAEALFTDDSLVVARLRMIESKSLVNLAIAASPADREALIRRSWSALLSVIALLQRRLAANTLLPGTVRKEETDYYAHALAALLAVQNEPVPPPSGLQTLASTIGYVVLLDALDKSLHFMPESFQMFWPAAQRKVVEMFVRAVVLLGPLLTTDIFIQVFQALDFIPRTAGFRGCMFSEEANLVALIEKDVSPQNFEPVFCAAVLHKWRSDAVSSVLRARGALQTGIANADQYTANFNARQRDDIAKHGLRDCALFSCAKTEKTVKEFAHCSGCRSVVYCCAEHQGLDWRAHKKACRVKEATRLAAEEGGEDAPGAGGEAA